MNRLLNFIAALSVCTALLAGCLLPAGRGAGNGQTTTEPSDTDTAENDTTVKGSRWGDIAVSSANAKTIRTGMTYREVESVMGPTNRYRMFSSIVSLSPFSDHVYPCRSLWLLDDDGLLVVEMKVNGYSYEEFVSEIGGWDYFSSESGRDPSDYFTVSSVSILYGEDATLPLTGNGQTITEPSGPETA